MLSNYYDKIKAKCFDKTFKDLYIGKNPTALKNSCSVLHFNFSGINIQNKDSIEQFFNLSVLNSLRVFIHDYLPDFKLYASLDASSMLNLLLGEAQKNSATKYMLLLTSTTILPVSCLVIIKAFLMKLFQEAVFSANFSKR